MTPQSRANLRQKIYLSGAIPEDEDMASHAGEAVISLARAVYARGGQLVINSDESLVALVAGEYVELDPVEEGRENPEISEEQQDWQPAVLVIGRDSGMQQAKILSLLQRFGYAAVNQDMRRIFGSVVAMVCIGSQNEGDWSLFRQHANNPRRMIVFPSTGATGPEDARLDFEAGFRETEEQFYEWLAHARERDGEEQLEPEIFGTSYPAIMQFLVEDLLGGSAETPRQARA
jgi:hypothetical protein